MPEESENQKDMSTDFQKDITSALVPYGDGILNAAMYNRANKLTTALFMVTDIMGENEPLRGRLRALGLDVISDIYSSPQNAVNRISEVLSFLNIAATINLVSEMNSSVLRKEFIELRKYLLGSSTPRIDFSRLFEGEMSLFQQEPENNQSQATPKAGLEEANVSARIGVQKGSTLLRALSKVNVSSQQKEIKNNQPKIIKDNLRDKRRSYIVDILKGASNSGLSIKDIRLTLKNKDQEGTIGQESEKTLQRELISMVTDGTLYRTGHKRWSRYFLKEK